MTISAAPQSVLDPTIERVGGLYSLPQVAVRLLALMERPQVDVHELKQCLEHDPALVAKVLRVVNSSLFGLAHRVTDLNQALTLLGTRPLKLLVLGFSLPKELLSGLEADVLARYWRRTLVKAVAARELTERLWLLPGDEAFIAGLLQDIGMLALIQDLGKQYTRLVEHALAEGSDLAGSEIGALGFDHAQLSAALLARWGLPDVLVRAVAARREGDLLEDGRRGHQRALPQALHLAELAAAFLVDGRPAALAELLDAGRAYRDLTLEQLTAVLERLDEQVTELAEVLSLELAPGENFAQVLAKAQRQLSGVLAELAACGSPARWQAAQAMEAGDWRGTMGAADCDHLAASVAGHAASADENPAFDPVFSGQVEAHIAASRAAHTSLSLLFIELDRYDELVLRHGTDGAARLSAAVAAAVKIACRAAAETLALDNGRVAVFLSGLDRSEAGNLARRALRTLAERLAGRGVTLSAGLATVALPPKNFSPQALIEAALRCLCAAQRSGGDSLKSIEL